MQTSTTVVTSLKRSSADADAMMVALERRIQANAHALTVKREEEEEEEKKKKKKRGGLTQRGSQYGAGRAEKDTNRMMTSSSREWWTKETKETKDDVHDVHDVHNEAAAAAAAAKKETTRGDAKRADAHFRKGLEMLRRNAPKEALGEFEMALERCPVHAKRARKTLENARERAMEMVYSGGTCAEDDDDDDDDDDEDVLTTSRETGKANEEEKKDVDVVDDEGRAKSSSMLGTKWERKTPTNTNREAIEELYDASRWLLRSTPRDGREAVRLLKMAERMLREDDDEKGEFLDDRERKEIRIAKEKIERAIKLVKR